MEQHKRTYSKDFKLEAIRLYESSGRSMRHIEEELGISAGLLNKGRARHRQDSQQAFVGTGHQTELEGELRRLKRENEGLRQERDVLKKCWWCSIGTLNKYAFMADHAGEFEVKLVCRVLAVSPIGFYAWRGRKPSGQEQANAMLLEEIRSIHR